MKRPHLLVLRVGGVILMILGSIWFLQGMNILPGSFMTGQVRWAYSGGAAFLLGVGILVVAMRRAKAIKAIQ
jgi:hypothetical protein